MRILISVSYYSPHISGLTNSIKNLAELLAGNGYDVTVLTTQHKKNLSLQESIRNVKVRRVPYILKISKGFFMPQFIFRAWKTMQQEDQVIINLPQPEGFVVAALAKLLGKRVYCIYACEVTLGNGFITKAVEHVLRFANMLALLFADKVITLTDDFKYKLPISDKKLSEVMVIYPVILPPVIKESLVKKFNQNKKRYRIGFVGRIATEKGIEYLLETIPLLKKEFNSDFEIVFAGPEEVVGEKKYLEKIGGLFEKEKEYLMQIGELKDDELGAFYASLDVLVLPSINSTEAFGMVQVEAMFCGTPVVVSDLPGVRMPVQATGMGEIARPRQPRDLAEKIAKVLLHRQQYFEKRNHAERVFSTEKILHQYNDILRE